MTGRIKTTFIKHLGRDLLEKYQAEFTTDFKKNKEVIRSKIYIRSKRTLNTLAGYITKQIKGGKG